MKKNLWLAGILGCLLVITWLLTEKKIFEHRPAAQEKIQNALVGIQHIQLPNAELSEEKGVWRLSDGEMARADYLQELHKSLEQITVSRIIAAKESGEFFARPIELTLGNTGITIGDLSATGESFYLRVKNDSNVYVVDLQQMSSLAMADDDNLLQREKYNRLVDLILLPAPRWRELRLAALTQFGSFKSWKVGDFVLTASKIKDRPWGEVLVQALQAGISSLEVLGEPLQEKPKKHAKIDDWEFTLDDGSSARWEFYEHPSLELVYVWIPRLKKAYPLNQGSSDFIKGFVPKLINRSFPLAIYPAKPNQAEVSEGNTLWKMNLNQQGQWAADAPINDKNAQALLDFFVTKQNFDYLTLLSEQDCTKLKKGSRFRVKINDNEWGVLPVKGALVLLECETQVALGWSPPMDSPLDFTSLRVKQ